MGHRKNSDKDIDFQLSTRHCCAHDFDGEMFAGNQFYSVDVISQMTARPGDQTGTH
jgi:hypothetical protein